MSVDKEITVVIPTYNRQNLVGRAVQSVLDQTVQPAEIIVVDDGSEDRTAEICQQYVPLVQYVRQGNAGVSAARNTGIRLAKSRWIAFLDSDDYFMPRHLERMLAAIEGTGGDAALYFADIQLPKQGNGVTLWQMLNFEPNLPFQLKRDSSAWVLLRRQPMMVQSSIISKRALENVGGFDSSRSVGEDSYLFCQLGIGGITCAVNGLGCVQTADDSSKVRLTVANPLISEAYVAEALDRWRQVLTWKDRLPQHFRRLVAFQLADAHWHLAKKLWQTRRWLKAIAHFTLAVQKDPHWAAWIMRHRTSDGYEETVRPPCPEQTINRASGQYLPGQPPV